jgi:H(+)-transporting ATP synthase subunit D
MSKNRTGISSILVSYSEILAIVGDIVRVKVPEEESGNGSSPCLEDLAVLEAVDGSLSLAQVIGIKRDVVALQVFNGTRGISTNSVVRFLGHPMQASYSGNIFGRVFRGTGEPIDGGPDLANDPKVTIGGPSVNPMRRVLASKMIRTNVPMIDVFNCLVESQKIPIFSVSGEPFNQLLARIGIQAVADVIVFGGMGLIFDDYYFFRKAFGTESAKQTNVEPDLPLMARISLNKSTLCEQIKQLKTYRNFLPSLDLKRRQLLSEQEKARQELRKLEERIAALHPMVEKQIPMLGYTHVEVRGIVRVTNVEIAEENVMGIRLPKLGNLEIKVSEYPFLGKPHWVDRVVQLLQQAIEIRMHRQVMERRLELLASSAKIVSQRVNLFDRVLIPKTEANIQRLRVSLSDSERASIVRAKIAKGEKGVA